MELATLQTVAAISAFVGFLLISASSGNYTGPQVFRHGIETFQDQGLVRNEQGQVVDYWRIIDGSVVRIRKLRIPTDKGLETFDVIIIQQREGNLRTEGDLVPQSTSTYVSWVPNLHAWVRHFWLEQYSDRFGKKQPDILDIAKSERDLYNGASTTIVITKENDLTQIEAIFRAVRKGNLPENQKLDIERGLGEAPPLPPPEIQVINGQEVAIGDYVELKSLTVNKARQIDFVPYLLVGLEASDLYAFGKRTIEINGKTYPWGASHLLVEAPPVQARYYKRDFGLTEDRTRRKGDLYWLGAEIPQFLTTLKDPARNKDRFTNAGMQEYISTPPISGWNYLPIPSRETKYDQNYRENSKLFPERIKRRLFFERDDVPFYRSNKFPQQGEVDFLLRSRPVLLHPFDPWKRLGFDVEKRPLRHFQIGDIHYFVHDQKVIDRVDRHQALIKRISAPSSDLTADDLYSDYGVNGEVRRLDDPIYEFGIQLHTATELAAFKRAKAEAFGIKLDHFDRRYVNEDIGPIDPESVLAKHRDLISRGFADTRFDYDAPSLDPSEIAGTILRNPFENYSEVDWALDYALSHRKHSANLEFSIAAALVQLLPTGIHGNDRLDLQTKESSGRELERQDKWIEKIFASLRQTPLEDKAARKELRSISQVRGHSRVRIARLLTDWGLDDPAELSLAFGNGLTQPDLTKKIIDAARRNVEFYGSLQTLSAERIVGDFGMRSIFSPNREPTQLGGTYGPQDPIFGKNPKSPREAIAELDQFLSILKVEWPELHRAFAQTYAIQIREFRKKNRSSPLQIIKNFCVTVAARLARLQGTSLK